MPHRVLMVDDEPNIVLSLEFLMKKAGYEVRTARDGEEALAEMRTRAPRSRPARRHDAQARRLRRLPDVRANPAWKGVRIVLLTAKGRDVEREKGLALGADDYITKPFSTREVVARSRGWWPAPWFGRWKRRAMRAPGAVASFLARWSSPRSRSPGLRCGGRSGAAVSASAPICRSPSSSPPRLAAAAYGLLHRKLLKPLATLTGELTMHAQTRIDRAPTIDPGHWLDGLPASVAKFACTLRARARRDRQGRDRRHLARGGAEEPARSDSARSHRRRDRLQSRSSHPALQSGRRPHSRPARDARASVGRCSACSPASRSSTRSSCCCRTGRGGERRRGVGREAVPGGGDAPLRVRDGRSRARCSQARLSLVREAIRDRVRLCADLRRRERANREPGAARRTAARGHGGMAATARQSARRRRDAGGHPDTRAERAQRLRGHRRQGGRGAQHARSAI